MARDIYHKHVKEALEKEGWKITADPFILIYAETRLDVDLGAEKLIEATRDSKKNPGRGKKLYGPISNLRISLSCRPILPLSFSHGRTEIR